MLKGNEQGALLASTRVRPVAANPPGELGLESAGWGHTNGAGCGGLGKRDRQQRRGQRGSAGSQLRGAVSNDHRAGPGKSAPCSEKEGEKPIREGLGLHPFLGSAGGVRAWHDWRARATIRRDPVFGNVTDGWVLGLEGWRNGVPSDTVALVENAVGHGPGQADLEDLPLSWRRWGETGCLTSLCIANGSLTPPRPPLGADASALSLSYDWLTPHCTGGSHSAAISVRDCCILGDVWGTDDRPGTYNLSNVSIKQDPWINKHVNGLTKRLNSSVLLEAWGFRWDARRRDWLKPLRRVDGSVVYVAWHETRFASDGVRGGIPGSRLDYPMYDAVSGRLIPVNESAHYADDTCSRAAAKGSRPEAEDAVEHVYVGLGGLAERLPSETTRTKLQASQRARQEAAAAMRREEVRQQRSWREFNRDPKQLDLLRRLHPLHEPREGHVEGDAESAARGGEQFAIAADRRKRQGGGVGPFQELARMQGDKELLAIGITAEREAAINRFVPPLLSVVALSVETCW